MQLKTEVTEEEAHRHHRVRNHMKERRAKKEKSKKKLEDTYQVPAIGVNLRDVGAVTRGPMREQALFRSSELLSKEEMTTHKIKTILDLRRMDRPCKKEPGGNKAAQSTKMVIKYLLLGPSRIIPEKRLLFIHRAQPHTCPLCHSRAEKRYCQDINVIHADLIPSTVGLRIFQLMPWRVRLQALGKACTGKGAASVMAPAVANPILLGYKALYKTLLEDSKRGMALALRPFVDIENYPILVHCIHGKDRTGLIIMLLLMLCDVPSEAIVDDYVLSETVLKESRMHDELHLDTYLTADDVIAATRDTMEDTIAYIKQRYDSVRGYMSEIGLEDWEIDKIQQNLSKEVQKPNLETPSASRPRFSIHTFFPFPRRESAPPAPVQGEEPGSNKNLGLQKSSSLESSFHRGSTPPTPATPNTPEEPPIIRRASLANSGPSEIRALMRKMRAEHPELASLKEEASSVDLLRISPNGLKDLPVRDPQTGLEGKVIAVSTEQPEQSAASLDKPRKSAEI